MERMDGFLFAELKAGNQRAFDKIFNDYYQNLCRLAYSIVHDEDNAHSLVQHVFVKLWENRSSLDHVDRLLPYLTSMVRNHCINFVNREKRNIKLADIPADTQIGNTTECQIDLDEFEEKLIIALNTLPERCKMAFEYSRFENLTNKEIAQRMEISVKGVEALIGRALKSLRMLLADYLPSSESKNIQSPILFFLFRFVRDKVLLKGLAE
jgi:RNA polymerase sigma-70 factor, ECF subfamily